MEKTQRLQPILMKQNRKTMLKLLVSLGIILPASAIQAQHTGKYLKEPLPETWVADSLFQNNAIDYSWWKSFNDPQLDSIINVAIQNNYNVLTAINRISAARAQMRSAYGALLPSFGLTADFTRARSSRNADPLLPSIYSSQYNAAIDMSWEVDIFGKIRNQANAQRKLYQASEDDYQSVMISLASQIASTYFQIRTAQQLLLVTDQNIKSQESILKITEVRYNTGLASQLDVAQAKSIYYNTQASRNSIMTTISNSINSLAVLMGTYPTQIRDAFMGAKDLPNPVHIIPVSIPGNLLLQRPDLRAAEKQIEAQAAQLGAAKADWLPSFFLNGAFGFSAPELNHLFEKNSQNWQIQPTMKWTIFNGGQRKEAVTAAKAVLEENINQFNLSMLSAVQEVESSMDAYKNSIREVNELRTVVNQGEITLKLSIDLYKEGLTEFQNVLSAQQSLLQYQSSLTQSQGNTLVYLVELYKALGGGWDTENNNNR